eukprot:gene10717-9686_t
MSKQGAHAAAVRAAGGGVSDDATESQISTVPQKLPPQSAKSAPKLVPLTSVIQEVNRRELAEETPEEEAARNKRGMIIGDAGDIHTIERAKPAPPQPGQYTIISKGTGKLPTFGTLEALTPEQQNVTQLMINDFGKMLRTKEAERKIGILPGNDTVQSLKDRFGKLPLHDDEVREQEEKVAAAERLVAEAEAQREQTAVMKEVESMSFEDILEEEKKRERKARLAETAYTNINGQPT